MVRKTQYLSQRVAKSETIRTISEVKNERAMQDEDTQLVKNVTSGDNPCPYCIATENLGFVPVENATIATHHPNCSCTPRYKKSIRKPKKWSDNTFKDRLQTEINKQNRKNKAQGRPITYIKPENPVNLRKDILNEKMGSPKSYT